MQKKFNWYRTTKIPHLNFKFLRSTPDGYFYLAFDGALTEQDFNTHNITDLGVMTIDEFSDTYNLQMPMGRGQK